MAFAGCVSASSLTLSGSVARIGGEAFASCRGLTRIDIPQGVEVLGNHAFALCTAVTEITVPSSTVQIAKSALNIYRSYKIRIEPQKLPMLAENMFALTAGVMGSLSDFDPDAADKDTVAALTECISPRILSLCTVAIDSDGLIRTVLKAGVLTAEAAEELLGLCHDPETRALLLSYLNGHASPTDIDGKYGL